MIYIFFYFSVFYTSLSFSINNGKIYLADLLSLRKLSRPSSLPARVAFRVKRYSGRERIRTAVFAGYDLLTLFRFHQSEKNCIRAEAARLGANCKGMYSFNRLVCMIKSHRSKILNWVIIYKLHIYKYKYIDLKFYYRVLQFSYCVFPFSLFTVLSSRLRYLRFFLPPSE